MPRAGMALRWLKPLEQGFDVKIIASTHGGCLRLLAPTSSNIKTLKDLKGKIIAVSDMNSPGKNFFSIRLKKAGLDPNTDVEFKQFPGPLLRVSVEKGEAHALADNDPITFLFQKDGTFREISSNLDNEYANRVCCIIGVRGSLIREDKPAAAAIARSLIEASEFAAPSSGRSRRDLRALCAGQDRACRPDHAGEIPHASSPSRRRRSEEGARGLCRGAEADLDLQAFDRYGEICRTHLCRRVELTGAGHVAF